MTNAALYYLARPNIWTADIAGVRALEEFSGGYANAGTTRYNFKLGGKFKQYRGIWKMFYGEEVS